MPPAPGLQGYTGIHVSEAPRLLSRRREGPVPGPAARGMAERDLPVQPGKPRPAGQGGAELPPCRQRLNQRGTRRPRSPWWRPHCWFGPGRAVGGARFGRPPRAPLTGLCGWLCPLVSFQALGLWSLLTTTRALRSGEPPDFGTVAVYLKPYKQFTANGAELTGQDLTARRP